MPHYVPLDRITHRQVKINTANIEAAAANETTVPVIINEFLKLAVQYPIVFTKHIDTGGFVCVALLGLDNSENLFWKSNRWEGVYTPISVMLQPFLLRIEDGAPVVTIDNTSSLLSASVGEDLYDRNGADAGYLTAIKKNLLQLEKGIEQTQEFIDRLMALSLIVPLVLDVTIPGQPDRKIQGLYTIDEEKLMGMGADDVWHLQQNGYLKSIYVLIASLGHIYSLIQRKTEKMTGQATINS